MTISTQQSSESFLGNGVTQLFSFTFVADSASDIEVSYTNASGIIAVLSASQYTLTLNSASVGQLWGQGGSVLYPTSGSPIAAGTSLTVQRVLPLQQLTSISNQGDFSPQVIETALDTLCMEIQQVSARSGQYRGVWQTGILYNYADTVTDGANGANSGSIYFCALTNTSSTWANDLSAGDWNLAIQASFPSASLPLSIANGGTSATTAVTALAALGGVSLAGSNTYTGTNDFTGATISVPTASGVENSTKAASTAFVATNYAALSGATFTGAITGTNETLSGTLQVSGLSGFGATPNTYQVKVVQAGANQAYFGSTGSNTATVVLDNAAGSQQDIIEFRDAGTAKWRLNKFTDNNFYLYDVANAKNFLYAAAGGILNLGSAQNSIIDVNGNFFLNTSGAGLNFNGVSYTAGVQISTGTNASQIQIASGTATGLSIQSTSGAGRVSASFFNGTTSSGFIGTSPGTATYNTTSDKRLKTNIVSLVDIGAKIDAIRPVTYNWQYIEGNPPGTGFVAQDLYAVVPEAVFVGDDGSVGLDGSVRQQWAVDYSKLVPYLVAEVQSLRARLKAAGIV